MKSRIHLTHKTQYRIKNWAKYEQGLIQRGDITVWLTPEAVSAWSPRRGRRPGGQRKYSDLAIETTLTLRLVFGLPLRQAEGFLRSLFGLMGSIFKCRITRRSLDGAEGWEFGCGTQPALGQST